jgi:hypothetical protein
MAGQLKIIWTRESHMNSLTLLLKLLTIQLDSYCDPSPILLRQQLLRIIFRSVHLLSIFLAN